MSNENAQLIEAVDLLRQEVEQLHARLTALELSARGKSNETVARPAPPSKPERVTEELLAVIGAALAAYLGVKPHIRQIRLINNNPWGLQGRVTIQASHAFATHYG